MTRSYLTTYGSVWLEAVANGTSTGLENEGRIAQAIQNALSQPVSNADPVFNNMLVQVLPFCRAFSASRAEVADTVANILPKLGNPVLVSDMERGIFQTGLIDRAHVAASWKDSYVITVTEERSNHVVVRTLRSVYVSRSGDPYNQALSSGQNEGWIYTQISDALGLSPGK